MPTRHPNRPNKRRGDKLNGWSHTSRPMSDVDRVRLEDPQITAGMTDRKCKKRYRMETKWNGEMVKIGLLWGDNDGWRLQGRYDRRQDAENALNTFLRKKDWVYQRTEMIRIVDMETREVILLQQVRK